jgi:Fe-S-cluster containining protein
VIQGGVCITHGAEKPKCSFLKEDGSRCTSNVVQGGVCITHGAERPKCSFLKEDGSRCTSYVVQGGVCVKHGAVTGERNNKCKYNSETMCGMHVNNYENRYDGACVRCLVPYNPNDPRATEANKRAKVKEQSVVDFVKGEFPTINWTCDRQIRSAFNDNFARVRPDMRALTKSIDIDTHDLIVEADEWRHDGEAYGGCKGENERIGAVWRNISGGKRSLVVVRINPDNYVDPATGTIVTSCFAYSKAKGKVGVKPSKETEWGARLEKLRQTIAYWTIEGNVPDKELTTIQLFY